MSISAKPRPKIQLLFQKDSRRNDDDDDDDFIFIFILFYFIIVIILIIIFQDHAAMRERRCMFAEKLRERGAIKITVSR